MDAPVRDAVWAIITGGATTMLLVMEALYLTVLLLIRRPMTGLLNAVETLRRGDYNAEVGGRSGVTRPAPSRWRWKVFATPWRKGSFMRRRRRWSAAMPSSPGPRRKLPAWRWRPSRARLSKRWAAGLPRLSAGDLAFRLNEKFAQEYEVLRADFNMAVSKLQDAMKAIAVNTQGVRAGSAEMTQASDDLARRTEQQASSLEETAASHGGDYHHREAERRQAQQANSWPQMPRADAKTCGVVVGRHRGGDGRASSASSEQDLARSSA